MKIKPLSVPMSNDHLLTKNKTFTNASPLGIDSKFCLNFINFSMTFSISITPENVGFMIFPGGREVKYLT